MKKVLLLIVLITGCARPFFKEQWTKEKSPETFMARFETSKGVFDVQVTRAFSPLGADRLFQLLKHRAYDHTLFYRVVPGFVAQFGISDTAIYRRWTAFKIADEKVVASNKKTAMSFARGGKESRGTTLFINLKDNPRLDTLVVAEVTGYPPLGYVIRGMDVVESLYSGYGEDSFRQAGILSRDRAAFLKTFPKLDSIIKAYILK